ncbi:siderophore-interacting protein [Vibrio viridaestus]|uniref:Siderophore-interacting protein n=1 Tax=Vibrio viridaestus TaxID=2487322 RepID=A0A3N9TE90_9VIBR|nr:siderophore-interacting protein [Vibrio viridaestus]RQW62547.1 siderophore-interacting protein [Vibrio viridaestus]
MSDSVERVYPMRLEFVRKQNISKSLIRVTVTGDRLNEFPDNCNGAHIKVFFPNIESGVLQLPVREGKVVHWPEHKPVARAYTVRRYCAETRELDIDFVDHGDISVGSKWAREAEAGSELGLVGPGGPNPLMKPAKWHLMAGDLTAVPAISAILEELPEQAKGEVFIEVDDMAEKHDLVHPEGITVFWLKRENGKESPLINALAEAKLPQDDIDLSAFVAGENAAVVGCRKILGKQHNLTRKSMYAIPYWCRGKNEEAYHHDRHAVMDEEY